MNLYLYKIKLEDYIERLVINYIVKKIEKGYDSDFYFDEIFFEGIKKLCSRKLADKNFIKYNPEKARLFKQTLSLIKKSVEEEDLLKAETKTKKAREHITKNLTCYWD